MPSSPTPAFTRIPLTEVFAQVPDPRARRGIRHGLPKILSIAAAAVAGGARSLLAIGEWVAGADRDVLVRLGIGPGDSVPSESTIRRTLAVVDPEDLDRRLGAWVAARVADLDGRRVIAVDGKSMRGAAVGGTRPRLLSALTYAQGVVVAQRAIADKGSEIPDPALPGRAVGGQHVDDEPVMVGERGRFGMQGDRCTRCDMAFDHGLGPVVHDRAGDPAEMGERPPMTVPEGRHVHARGETRERVSGVGQRHVEGVDVPNADVGEQVAFLAPVDLGLRARDHLETAVQPDQRILIRDRQLGGHPGRSTARYSLTRW